MMKTKIQQLIVNNFNNIIINNKNYGNKIIMIYIVLCGNYLLKSKVYINSLLKKYDINECIKHNKNLIVIKTIIYSQ